MWKLYVGSREYAVVEDGMRKLMVFIFVRFGNY